MKCARLYGSLFVLLFTVFLSSCGGSVQLHTAPPPVVHTFASSYDGSMMTSVTGEVVFGILVESQQGETLKIYIDIPNLGDVGSDHETGHISPPPSNEITFSAQNAHVHLTFTGTVQNNGSLSGTCILLQDDYDSGNTCSTWTLTPDPAVS